MLEELKNLINNDIEGSLKLEIPDLKGKRIIVELNASLSVNGFMVHGIESIEFVGSSDCVYVYFYKNGSCIGAVTMLGFSHFSFSKFKFVHCDKYYYTFDYSLRSTNEVL